MHSFKRVFYLLLPLTFLISGCAQETASNKITVWHWMTDREAAFEELAKKYEELTGIKVEFELYSPPGTYSQKIRASAQGKTLPDIFGILGEKRDFASFVKAGHIMDLTPSMQEEDAAWESSFFPESLRVSIFEEGNEYEVNPGIYGVPIDVMNIQVVYNKTLFEKAGLNPDRPPQTWEEFIKQAKIISEKLDVYGFVGGWAETWMIDCFASNYAMNIMGEERYFETLKGQIPYTSSEWIRVFSLFKELRTQGVISQDIISMQNKEAEQLFANGRAAFAFNGSWCVNVYKGMNPDLRYGVIPPPAISGKYPVRIWGGAGSSFMVNDRSPVKEEAVRFLKWLTAPEQQVYLAETTNNIPSVKTCVDVISPVLREFADDMKIVTHPNVWPVREKSRVIEILTKGVQYIVTGEKAPGDIAREVQDIKSEEMRRQ